MKSCGVSLSEIASISLPKTPLPLPPQVGRPLLTINSPLTLSLHYIGAIYWCVIVFELVRCGTLEGRKKQGGGPFSSLSAPASNILRPHHYTVYSMSGYFCTNVSNKILEASYTHGWLGNSPVIFYMKAYLTLP